MPQANIDPDHLAKLRDHYARYGALPSYAGIGEVVGFRGKTAAVKLAQRLSEAGFLRPATRGKLAPTERFFALPLLDTPIHAGLPESIDGQVSAEDVTLSSYLVEVPSQSVLIPVRGDSMIDAGVRDGDLAVVERAQTARSGDFVVAIVDGEFTFKELRLEGRVQVLHPHNADFVPIRAKNALQIFGVVRGIVRRYRTSTALKRHRQTGGTA